MIGALIFPFGPVTFVVTGADLCTGSFMVSLDSWEPDGLWWPEADDWRKYTTISVLHGRLSIYKMLLHWFVTFCGNLAGSLTAMGLILGYGGVFKLAAYKTEVFNFAAAKVVVPEWHLIFLRGVGANWLVCLACFLAFSAREYFSKAVAIWWPTFACACLGFDHVVANMTFIPTAIFLGDPVITVSFYVWKGVIPAPLGNIVGGGLMVGVMYWCLVRLRNTRGINTEMTNMLTTSLHHSFITGSSSPITINGDLYESDVQPLVGNDSSTPTDGNAHSTKPSPEKTREQMV